MVGCEKLWLSLFWGVKWYMQRKNKDRVRKREKESETHTFIMVITVLHMSNSRPAGRTRPAASFYSVQRNVQRKI